MRTRGTEKARNKVVGKRNGIRDRGDDAEQYRCLS